MTYIAKTNFIGVVGGMEVPFAVGQAISAADAKELDLANKTELAELTKKGGADVATS